MECPFCKIAKKEIESVFIYEDDYVVAILDIFPSIPGQAIVFPKKHIKYIWDLSDVEIARIFTLIKIIGKVLKKVLNSQGISIYIPQDQVAGQKFDHLIVYIFPRNNGDKFVIGWERKQVDLHDLQKLSEKLKQEIGNILNNPEIMDRELKSGEEDKIDYSKWYQWHIRKP